MNHYTQRAIEMAQEAGWKAKSSAFKLTSQEIADEYIELAVLDPEFWKCLGKAKGWDSPDGPMWLFKQHRFIDHLAEGKESESFFQLILGEK